MFDLGMFCINEKCRYDIMTPWVMGGWQYATDGRILIRIPSTEEDTKDIEIPPKTESFMKHPNITTWTAWPKQVEKLRDTLRRCTACAGTGREGVECTKCKGAGELYCETCEHDYLCPKCKGRSFTPTGKGCYDCEGTGKKYFFRIGHCLIAHRYHQLVTQFQDIEYCSETPVLPLCVKCVHDGVHIEIIVMPVTADEAELVKEPDGAASQEGVSDE